MGAPSDEAASAISLSDSLAAALSTLDAAGVRWCLLRGAVELERAQDDVDLLVDRDDISTLRRVIADAAGFAPMAAWGRAPHRFFVAPATVDPIKLDVVTELAFGRHGELRTDRAIADAVLDRRRRVGALALPERDDALWALLAHAILDRRVVRPARREEIRALAADAGDGSPLAGVVGAACPDGWDAARVRTAAAAGSFDELVALAGALRANWPGAGRARVVARVALSRALRRAQRARQSNGLMTSNSRLRSTG